MAPFDQLPETQIVALVQYALSNKEAYEAFIKLERVQTEFHALEDLLVIMYNFRHSYMPNLSFPTNDFEAKRSLFNTIVTAYKDDMTSGYSADVDASPLLDFIEELGVDHINSSVGFETFMETLGEPVGYYMSDKYIFNLD